ncbi:MAG TPA: prepilin-type N-terminal cleavage/methylation domain-containing protein [Fibrobacteria bacterium]|nr:prepilin-type N-terminal cleavage/methylation domain-containing protein [Fibrobacteria bacterium]
MKKNAGFTMLEIVIAIIVICVLTGLCIKPVNALLEKLKLQNAADGMKHYILNARVRAVSNSNRHCGVVMRIHTGTIVDDTLFAFFDKNPPDNLYVPGMDELYSTPLVIAKEKRLSTRIPSGFPSVLVFRGDGSANTSAKVVLTLGAFEDTVDVLASTGRVKVINK